MKQAVTSVYILSVVLIILFFFTLIASIIGRVIYIAPEQSEPLETILSKGIYNVFIILALAGIFNSVLLFMCLHSFAKRKQYSINSKNVFKSVPFFSAVMCNLLFYLFAIIIFTSESYLLLAIPIVWVISFAIFIISFLDLKSLYKG